ncbi:MAG: hypothetical protein MUD01_06330 [Chloroflexaceae bacterium]|jgi:hypothetical protein|nr:hypothetical protein [Chloroflexaceae bacterium]
MMQKLLRPIFLLMILALVALAPSVAVRANNNEHATNAQPATITIQAAELARFQLTDAARVQQYTADATARWAKEFNAVIDPATLAVYDLRPLMGTPGEPLIAIYPKDELPSTVTMITNPDGTMTVRSSVSVSAVAPPKPVYLPAAAFRVYLPAVQKQITTNQVWEQTNFNCRDDPAQYGIMSSCWYTYRMLNDSDPNRDYWALKQKATVQTVSGYALTMASVASKPIVRTGTIDTVKWYGWEPGQSRAGECITVTLILTPFGIGAELPINMCESWVIDKSPSVPGEFKTTWRMFPAMVLYYPHSREVGSVIAIATAPGQDVGWDLTKEFLGEWNPP